MISRTKRIFLLSLFLAFCLQATPVKAGEFLTSLSDQFISWVNKKEAGPVLWLGAAVVGMLYLWKTKKSNEPQSPEKPPTTQPAPLNTGTPPSFEDIYVTPQGSNLQCGYHALKNSLIALDQNRTNQPINPNDDRFKSSNSEILVDTSSWQDLLPKWQNKIENYRKKRVLKELIQTHLKALIINNDPEKKEDQSVFSWLLQKLPWFKAEKKAPLYDDYRSVLFNVAQGLANAIVESPTDLEEITYSYSDIKEALSNAIKNNNKKQALLDSFASYLPEIENLNFTIASQEIKSAYTKTYPSKLEDLDGDEIKYLLQETTNFKKLRKQFTIVDDVEMAEFQENFDKAAQNWQKQDTSNYTHYFLLGTMNQDSMNASGHWYMVATQKYKSKKSVYIADSLNAKRTDDARVKKLIQKLETFKKV